MEKGISTWLYSKIVMLIFLVLVFSSTLSIMNIISERAYADSAEIIAVNIRDAMQGVITSGALSAQRVVPLPKSIPEGIQATRAREYTVVIEKGGSGSSITISIAVAWGSFSSKSQIKSYVSAAFLYVPDGTDFNLDEPGKNPLVLSSSDFRFFVVNKTTRGGPLIYVGGCKKAGLTSCVPT